MKYAILALPLLLILSGSGCGRRPLIDLTPTAALPTEVAERDDPSEPQPTVPVAPSGAENLANLKAVDLPFADPEDLARRLSGFDQEVPETIEPPEVLPSIGDRSTFWVSNYDRDEQFQVSATLQHSTDTAYYWIDDDADFKLQELKDLGEVFENQIYPQTRSVFGTEWNPGIDGDPHIYVLYASGIGSSVLGLFSSVDSIHPLLRDDSNGHEMFVFNADRLELSDPLTHSVLAHEYQHMIHWNMDPDETRWLNEGFSELAERVNRMFGGAVFRLYIDNPDLQLNDWPYGDESTIPYYGASSLFTNYFYDRFGPDAVRTLVAHPENGLESVDLVLRDLEGVGSSGADSFVMDWAITNFLNDGQVGDGRFAYADFPSFETAEPTHTDYFCPSQRFERSAHQYGVHYLRIACRETVTLRFEGALETELLPADPLSGEYAFWSNKGDDSDMRLTREFDFSGVEPPVSMRFMTWYDIETDWDYVYLLASDDGGATWKFVETLHGSDEDPLGNNYGFGWTAASPEGGWIEEMVDLSEFAGRKITLRFEYVTDQSVYGEGMLIDDVSIPETGYFADFEADDGGWLAEGWVRTGNALPQSFELALLTFGDETRVDYLNLDTDNTVEVPFSSSDERVLVVVPTARFTRQPATYSVSFGE